MNVLDRIRDRWEKPVAMVTAVFGVALLVAGWIGVSGQGLITAQLPYVVSGAVGGLFALAAAATLWLSSDMRDEFFKLDQIYEELRADRDFSPLGDFVEPGQAGVHLSLGFPGYRARQIRVVGGRVGPRWSAPPVGLIDSAVPDSHTVTLPRKPRAYSLDPLALKRETQRVSGPWSPDQLLWVVGSNGVGLALIVAGWWVVSGSGDGHVQLGWLDVAFIGLMMAVGMNAWWLARCRQVILAARRVVLSPDQIRIVHDRRRATTLDRPPAQVLGTIHALPGLVSGPGMTWYHRSTCPLAAGKDIRTASRAEWQGAGATECEVCRP